MWATKTGIGTQAGITSAFTLCSVPTYYGNMLEPNTGQETAGPYGVLIPLLGQVLTAEFSTL